MSSRLMEVLFTFRSGRTKLTLAELTRHTGMPAATVRRLALELVEAGALDMGPDGTLSIGTRLWQLGTLAPLTEPLRNIALPVMEDLYASLNQHVQLAVLDGHEAVVVERLSKPGAVGLISRVGGRLPLHSSAVGKVLLAHAGPELFDTVVSRGLQRFTEHTITDAETLRRDLGECRRTSTAIVRGEMTRGVDSVATRIVDAEGRVVAALSVVVRADSVALSAAIPTVVAGGLWISRKLGWIPGVPIRSN